MYMKTHILAAMREEFEHWEKVLASLSEAQINTPVSPSELSVKDEMAHLWAWQQRSQARVAAAVQGREPQFPQWIPGVDPEDEDSTDRNNAWIFETNHDLPWSTVHEKWRSGYLRLLELGDALPESAFLDSSRYGWMEGLPIAFVFVASYDHHQEHLDKLLARLS